MDDFLSADYWNNRYQKKQTGWDIGAVSLPLKTYIDQINDKNLPILIPGAGNAYEAIYLLQQGFKNVTVIDIAPAVTEQLKDQYQQLYPNQLTVITGDFFELKVQYDLILEQTFFCALDPALRMKYAQQMVRLLKPTGKLAGVLFNREFAGGPPFGGSLEEYTTLFAPYFQIEIMTPCYNSIPARAGTELFIQLSPKPLSR